MFQMHSEPEELNSIISQINSLKPNKNAIPSKWKNIFSELSVFLQENQDECNNDKLICAIINFISNFDFSKAQGIFNNCMQINIGLLHSLWYTCIAIECERSRKYIEALDIFEISLEREAQPIDFLIQNFDSFKERMLKRLYGNYSLELGSLDDSAYRYEDGGISCKNVNTNLPAIPKYDFLEIIGFDPSQAKEYTSPQSFSRSKSSFVSKSSNIKQDLNLSPPIFEQVEYPFSGSFRQQNQSSFLSPTSQPQVQTSFSIQRQPYEQQENEPESFFQSQPFSNQNPSSQLNANNDQSQPDLSFQFNHAEPKRGILKKNSPSPSRNNTSGVKFNNKPQQTNDKKRASTPVGKNNKLEVGAKIYADIFEFHIQQQIGSGAFLATAEGKKYVIKRIPPNFSRFSPNYPFLFSLPIENINTFYVTEFCTLGTFDKIIPYIHKSSRVEESVALLFLMQLLLIIDDLEAKFMCHGNICSEKLLLKYSKSPLPEEFSLDDPVWEEVGIKLCALDEIKYDEEDIEDRKAVARLFYFIAKKKEIDDEFEKPPLRWNSEIWTTTFNLLQNRDPLGPLIDLINNYLQKKIIVLRSSVSRIYIPIV